MNNFHHPRWIPKVGVESLRYHPYLMDTDTLTKYEKTPVVKGRVLTIFNIKENNLWRLMWNRITFRKYKNLQPRAYHKHSKANINSKKIGYIYKHLKLCNIPTRYAIQGIVPYDLNKCYTIINVWDMQDSKYLNAEELKKFLIKYNLSPYKVSSYGTVKVFTLYDSIEEIYSAKKRGMVYTALDGSHSFRV